jgi:hypothetical protein
VSPSASLRLRIAAPSGFRGSVTWVTTFRWFSYWTREYIAYSLSPKPANTQKTAVCQIGKPERTHFMAQTCSKCNGTGKCQQCKGTGHLGYPGYGPVKNYPDRCLYCGSSGVCKVCHGSGQK